MTEWKEYHRKSAGLPPRPLLLNALKMFSEPGHALDMGCGTGRDTHFLLSQGWSVLAIDTQQPALDQLRNAIPAGTKSRCQTRCASMETAEFVAADLVNAAFSLPFCDPAKGRSVWTKIGQSLKPRGVFVGQFFGPQDAWAGTGLWTVSKEEVADMLFGWHVQSLSEFEGMRRTFTGAEKWSHVFDVIAQRPDGAS